MVGRKWGAGVDARKAFQRSSCFHLGVDVFVRIATKRRALGAE